MKSKRKLRERAEPEAAPPAEPKVLRIAVLVLCVATAAAAVGVVWGVPRPIGDLYVALAAGRDIVAGKLGQPDDWSFLTTDRVWIDQNWGTHLLCYLFYCLGGNTGLLVLKAAMVAGVAGFMALWARQRGSDWPVAALVAGGVVLAANGYIDMRPNLTTLVMAPLLVAAMYLTRRRVHLIWLSVAIVGIWANMHGGFVFGIGLLGLWGLCRTAGDALREGPRVAIKRCWPLLAGPLVAIALAGLASPFGIENLTHPFTVGRAEIWRRVSEWRSVFEKATFGSLWEFWAFAGTLAGLLAIRSLAGAARRRPLAGQDPRLSTAILQTCFLGAILLVAYRAEVAEFMRGSAEDRRIVESRRMYVLVAFGVLAVIASPAALRTFVAAIRQRRGIDPRWLGVVGFEAIVLVVVTTMALRARRFIPLAMILMAPVVAEQVGWLVRSVRRRWLIAVAAAGLLVPVVMMARKEFRLYAPDNALYPRETIFERMHSYRTWYAPGVAQFVQDNGLIGRVFQEWRWEGFLRWTCPQLELFVGGRAQQVYTEGMFEEQQRFSHGAWAADALDRYRIRFTILPALGRYDDFHNATVFGPKAKGVCLYYDGYNAVVANGTLKENADLIRRAAAGALVYPDPATAALSRAFCLKSNPIRGRAQDVYDALAEANRYRPLKVTYENLQGMAAAGLVDHVKFVRYLEAEHTRLGVLDYERANGLELLAARMKVVELLIEAYRSAERFGDADRLRAELDRLTEAREQLVERNT